MPRDSFKEKLAVKRANGQFWPAGDGQIGRQRALPSLHDRQSGREIGLNETMGIIKASFKDETRFDKWFACCSQALECCQRNAATGSLTVGANVQVNKQTNQLEDRPVPRDRCPATWDGLTCWPEWPAGQLAWLECPRHVYFLSFEPACAGYVTKQCFPNGSWFIRNEHEWSDYSQCPNLPVSIFFFFFDHNLIIIY